MYVTINTRKELYQYNHLLYGVASCPGIFQKLTEQIFANYSGVAIFLNDITVGAENEEKHLKILNDVFDRL